MITRTIREGNTLIVLSRVKGVDFEDIDQSSLTNLAWKLTRQKDGSSVVALVNLVIADQVYNTIQSVVLPDGTFYYNFRHVINGTNFTQPGTTYVASYKFTDLDGFQYWEDIEIFIEADS